MSLKFHKNNNLVALENETDITEQNEPADSDKPVSDDEFKSLVDISSLAQDAEDKSLEAPLTPAIKEVVVEELAEILGPVAGIFVSDLDGDITLISALNILAREIEDVDTGIEFINNVKAKIWNSQRAAPVRQVNLNAVYLDYRYRRSIVYETSK